MNRLTVVIPVRKGGFPEITLRTLAQQSYQDFEIVVAWDEKGSANWARNQGFRLVRTPFVLFSDDDIEWEPEALRALMATLHNHPEASYAYGAYELDNGIHCNQRFDEHRLRRGNFISTMALIRTDDFPGFDEQIQRLQEWDLWLTMLEAGNTGAYCGRVTFRTAKRAGITFGPGISWHEAERAVKAKHRL